MSEVLQAIKNRRTIRKFEEKAVSEEVLNQLLEAIQMSPSWANTQCWEVIVVKDQARREALQATLSKGNPATKALVAAPLLLVMAGKKESSGYYGGAVTTKFGDWIMFDLGIATQSLCLAGYALGLGSVVVGLFDQDAAAKALEVPAGYEVVAMVPMGYPAKSPSAPPRKAVADFVHVDKF
ncbi:MAG: nitroreductase family protein [Deltaproteobacteria bacterium]|nr:nitroreductase family protein [Deltaproteobacteria bacterium]